MLPALFICKLCSPNNRAVAIGLCQTMSFKLIKIVRSALGVPAFPTPTATRQSPLLLSQTNPFVCSHQKIRQSVLLECVCVSATPAFCFVFTIAVVLFLGLSSLTSSLPWHFPFSTPFNSPNALPLRTTFCVCNNFCPHSQGHQQRPHQYFWNFFLSHCFPPRHIASMEKLLWRLWKKTEGMR